MLTLDDEGMALRVAIDTTLDAVAVEQLIHELAILRAQMQPEVASETHEWLAGAGSVLDEEFPQVLLRGHPDGDVLVALRNRGLGWLRFRIADPQARQIGAFLLDEDRNRVRPQH